MNIKDLYLKQEELMNKVVEVSGIEIKNTLVL